MALIEQINATGADLLIRCRAIAGCPPSQCCLTGPERSIDDARAMVIDCLRSHDVNVPDDGTITLRLTSPGHR